MFFLTFTFSIKYTERAVVTARATVPLLKFIFSRNYRRSCKELVARRKNLSDAVRSAVNEYFHRFKNDWNQRLVPGKLLINPEEGQNTRRKSRMPFSPLSNSYENTNARANGDIFNGIADDLFVGDALL